MEIISTNIGEPVVIEWRGQKLLTGIFKYPVDKSIYLGKGNVENDHVIDQRFHGGADKACYLYSADHYSFWSRQYPDVKLQWGMFGENLTVKGLDESLIHIGDQYKIGTAVIQVTQPRQPCFKLGIRFNDQKVVSDFWDLPFSGVYVRVLEEGVVSAGDKIVLICRYPQSFTVAEVFSFFSSGKNNHESIRLSISDPNLAASCRRDLEKLLNN